MSAWVTSFSLIATIPLELRLLIWLPAMPVKTSVIAQSAISSASSSTRWIDAIVASMLTTTPFFRPREGCVPRPMMFSFFSGVISATMATIFEVPMSSPTIRFFASLTMRLSPRFFTISVTQDHGSSRLLHGAFLESRAARGETVAISQIGVLDASAGTGKRTDGPCVIGDEAIQAFFRVAAPERDRQRGHRGGLELPAAARGQPDLADGQPGALEGIAEDREARAHFSGTSLGSGELRQLAIVVRDKNFALFVDERVVIPSRKRRVFGDEYLQPVRPLPSQRNAAHPGHALQRAARLGPLHREESASKLLANDRLEVRRVPPRQWAGDRDLPQSEDRLAHRPRRRSPANAHECQYRH